MKQINLKCSITCKNCDEAIRHVNVDDEGMEVGKTLHCPECNIVIGTIEVKLKKEVLAYNFGGLTLKDLSGMLG